MSVPATLQPDGVTLRLEEKLTLPPGRVNVTIQPAELPGGPTMLEVLSRIHEEQLQRGRRAMTEEEMAAEIAQMRDEDRTTRSAGGRSGRRSLRESKQTDKSPCWSTSKVLSVFMRLTAHRRFKQGLSGGLSAIGAAGDRPAISDLTWLECRVRPIRMNDMMALADMEAFLGASDVTRVPMPLAVYDRACRIRAIHNFKLADALALGRRD